MQLTREHLIKLVENSTTYETTSGPYTEAIFNEAKFAQLIAKDCILTIQRQIVRNGMTPENIRSYQHVEDLAARYGIELPITDYER